METPEEENYLAACIRQQEKEQGPPEPLYHEVIINGIRGLSRQEKRHQQRHSTFAKGTCGCNDCIIPVPVPAATKENQQQQRPNIPLGSSCCTCGDCANKKQRIAPPRSPVIMPPRYVNPPIPVLKKKRQDNVADRYHVLKRLGRGSYGEIFLGMNTLTRENVAIKVERPKSNQTPSLKHESDILLSLQGERGVPFWKHFGYIESYPVLVTEVLGPNLMELYRANKGFTIKTILMLGHQLISRLEHLHSRNIVHRDLKPENILMGAAPDSKEVFLIDFGLAKNFRHSVTLAHIPEKKRAHKGGTGRGVVGTIRYSSLTNHLGYECSRRDDIESLAYILIFFAHGHLPWQGIVCSNKKENAEKIMLKKMSTPIAELCRGLPGSIFTKLLMYARDLRFTEAPDYSYLHQLFLQEMDNLGLNFDNRFDWLDNNVSNNASQFTMQRFNNINRLGWILTPATSQLNQGGHRIYTSSSTNNNSTRFNTSQTSTSGLVYEKVGMPGVRWETQLQHQKNKLYSKQLIEVMDSSYNTSGSPPHAKQAKVTTTMATSTTTNSSSINSPPGLVTRLMDNSVFNGNGNLISSEEGYPWRINIDPSSSSQRILHEAEMEANAKFGGHEG